MYTRNSFMSFSKFYISSYIYIHVCMRGNLERWVIRSNILDCIFGGSFLSGMTQDCNLTTRVVHVSPITNHLSLIHVPVLVFLEL